MSTSNEFENRGNSTMNKCLERISALIYLIFAGFIMQAPASAATLDDITYSSLPGDRVQMELKLSEPLSAQPLNFTIDNPARIVLDFPDTSLNIAEKNKIVGIGAVHSVSSVEAAGRTRVVLNLVKLVSYEMDVQGDKVKLIMAAADTSSTVAERTTTPTGGGVSTGAPTASIENIDFRRGEAGEGRVIVTLSDPSIGVNLGQQGEKIVIDFLDTALPEELNRRLEVIDFATPVKEIDTSPSGKDVRMVITTTTLNYDHLAYQSDNLLTIELKPLSKQEQEAAQKEKFGYTGERLSLNFQNIEVRAVLQL
ncbi:MAG: AMIN domain-containing protein, partial [Gammaproteobacteria bacterium]